jgi:hypothetical protein
VLVAFAAGLSLLLPPGWRVAHPALLEPCTNPLPRLAVAHGRSLVLLEEALDQEGYLAEFPVRPHHFRVRGAARFISCCAAKNAGKGWGLSFRQNGRAFYAYVYGDPPSQRW